MSSDPAGHCRAAYDSWAATYDSIDNPLIAEAAVAIDEHAGWLGGARVLELGCGTGRNAALALAAGAQRYVGVDASAAMLAVARGRVDDARAAWIEADLVAGTEAARAGGAGFDFVLICLVLEHIAEVAPVVAAAAAALVPGGRLLLVELHPALHDLGVGANFRIGEREVRLPSFRHDAAELVPLLERAGLVPLTTSDRAPSAAALARSPKLARYAGRPVVLEIAAQRSQGV